MRRTFVVIPALAAVLAACSAGPTYRDPPGVAVAPGWIGAGSDDAVDEAWWQAFGDPVLARLVASASERNLDLRVARARLVEARANRDVIGGGARPQVNVAASATTNRLSENGQLPVGRIPGLARDFDLFDAGFDASWEIDLWGHTRRTIEGARARAEVAEASLRDARLSVRAEIARTYVELRAAQARLASLTADADAQQRIAMLTQERFEAGEASRFDADRARGLSRSTDAQIPAVRAQVDAAVWRLALLTGEPPERADPALRTPGPIPQPPDAVARGLRSELLRRRPDVRVAERTLAAASADVGAATADLFPRLTLLGAIGQQARSAGDLGEGASTRYTLGPQLHWPLLDRGRLHAAVRAAGARNEAAAARYESAVLGALDETETAANGYARASEAYARSREALEAQRSALDLARQRQTAGESDLIELLTVESAYASVQQATTQAEATRALQAIALYKALGGGAEDPAPPR